MLRLVIDWASDKLASALSWIKEMASSFGFGLRKKDIAENEGVSPVNPMAHFSPSQTTPGPHYEKPCRAKCLEKLRCAKCPKRGLTGFDQNWKTVTDYPFAHSPCSRTNGRHSEFYCFPGHAKVKLLPFVRIPSNLTVSNQFDIPPEAKTYAGVVKTQPHCAKWTSEHDGCCKKLLWEMQLRKSRRGVFSVFIQIDEADECGADATAKMCPTTWSMLTKVHEKITELFGKATALEETIVFQDGKRMRAIYLAPSIDREDTRVNIINDDEIEKEEPEQESKKPVEISVPDMSPKEEDHYLVLEDKLMRRQDYDRKRKQGKANRRRLRQPATSVPVTKREVSLMGTKSEPISMKNSRKRNSRKERADEVDEPDNRKSEDEFPLEKNIAMKLCEFDFDGYYCDDKRSKRTKLLEANFRRVFRKRSQKIF